jgi:hypothetical protein
MTPELAKQYADSPKAFETPWNPTAEDFERDGFYADYSAWERWVGGYLESQPNDNPFVAWESMDMLARIGFYTTMVHCCEVAGKAKQTC